MRAAVLTEGAHCEIRDVPAPVPGPGEIRVRVVAAGICGTDHSIRVGQFPSARGRPLIMGHEFSGTVEAVGPGTGGFAPGDRVAADPNFFCRACEWCSRGAPNLCVAWGAVGLTAPGALAELVCLPAAGAVHLPDDVSFRAGALIEPLSCVLHAFDYAGLRSDSTTLIVGAGMLGLSSLIVARSRGHRVHVIEPHAPRRRRALDLGAEEAVAPGESLSVMEFDVVIEATGVGDAVVDALGRLRTRGTFLQLGATSPEIEVAIRPFDVFQRELRIIGSFSLADRYPEAADVIRDVANEFESLVTHTFPLEEFEVAMATMTIPEAVKIHITPNETGAK